MEDHSTLAPLALQQLERAVEAAGKLLTIEALTAAYLLAEAQGAEAGGSESAAGARPLGKGTGAVVDHLSVLLARPAAGGGTG